MSFTRPRLLCVTMTSTTSRHSIKFSVLNQFSPRETRCSVLRVPLLQWELEWNQSKISLCHWSCVCNKHTPVGLITYCWFAAFNISILPTSSRFYVCFNFVKRIFVKLDSQVCKNVFSIQRLIHTENNVNKLEHPVLLLESVNHINYPGEVTLGLHAMRSYYFCS